MKYFTFNAKQRPFRGLNWLTRLKGSNLVPCGLANPFLPLSYSEASLGSHSLGRSRVPFCVAFISLGTLVQPVRTTANQ